LKICHSNCAYVVKQVAGIGVVASECGRHETPKENDMADRPEDNGNGALFKNDKKEKHPHQTFTGAHGTPLQPTRVHGGAV
jgi:hypothetical protein